MLFLRRMKKIVIVAIILFIGFVLRIHNYELYPQRGASSDEYTYSFLGVSLLTKGVPESWSNLNAYKNNYDLTIRKLYFPMVYPYFDHPPLNGLLVGGWSILNKQATFETVDLKTIRLVPIFLSLISIALVFLLALKLFDYLTAVWAILIYSTVTIFVMNQRVVFAENLLTPLFLGSLCIYAYSKKITFRKTILIGILSGLAFWTKELGIGVFFTMFYLFFEEHKKPMFIFALSALFLIFFIGYIGYGYYYDGNLFWKIVSIQSARPIGPDTLLLLTAHPIIVNKPYFDGWYFLGFLSIFFGLFDLKKYKMIAIPALIYLMLMLFSLNKTGEMGWYMIPMFPFMAVMTANLIKEGLRKESWFIFLLLLFIGLYEIKYLYEANFGLTYLQFRILLFMIFGPFILLRLFHKENAFRLLGNIWFYFLILGTIVLTYSYTHPA